MFPTQLILTAINVVLGSPEIYISFRDCISPQVDDQDCVQSAAGFAALLLAEETLPETRLLTTAAISGHYGVIR